MRNAARRHISQAESLLHESGLVSAELPQSRSENERDKGSNVERNAERQEKELRRRDDAREEKRDEHDESDDDSDEDARTNMTMNLRANMTRTCGDSQQHEAEAEHELEADDAESNGSVITTATSTIPNVAYVPSADRAVSSMSIRTASIT